MIGPNCLARESCNRNWVAFLLLWAAASWNDTVSSGLRVSLRSWQLAPATLGLGRTREPQVTADSTLTRFSDSHSPCTPFQWQQASYMWQLNCCQAADMKWAGAFRLFWVLDLKVMPWTWALILHWLSTGQLFANSLLNLVRPQSRSSWIWAELLRGWGSLGRETHALKDWGWGLRSQHCYRKLESSRRYTRKNKHRKNQRPQ